jgi:hypothetical protein
VDVQCADAALLNRSHRIPVYGGTVGLKGEGETVLQGERSQQRVGLLVRSQDRMLVRLGYDLFDETRILLTEGQPPEHAPIQTLELHIALLRDLIVRAGVQLVELPPIPDGFRFIACLTHDVDHPSIRFHRWDHTMFGFLYRAVIGSVRRVLAGRMPVGDLVKNWLAAVQLPLVHLGLARDTWSGFDRYLQLERGFPSTFFVLPFKGEPGIGASGRAPSKRASAYAAADIGARLRRLVAAGSEVGLHGLDAWADSARGANELGEIARIAGRSDLGVRMHWLYWGPDSAAKLEQAGFNFDSTIGYNQTVGYRAGTGQVFKLLGTRALLELPLHVMDTAMFYPRHLNLTFDEAERRLGAMIEVARDFGGVLTINWHDRSIAPERLWGGFYVRLLERLVSHGAWCTSASRAVRWFRRRRSVVLRRAPRGIEMALPDEQQGMDDDLPALRVRIHNPGGSTSRSAPGYVDHALTSATRFPSNAGASVSGISCAELTRA